MNKLQEIVNLYPDMEFLSADGFEDCIIGFEPNDGKLIYSIQKCIETLMQHHEIEYDEAIEFFEFNVLGCYMGEKTPIFIYTI